MSQRREDVSMVPIVYRDFTAGLYERGNDREVPTNGLLECQDCMPLPSGGLRAAWAWRKESAGGLPASGNSLHGFFAYDHILPVPGGTTALAPLKLYALVGNGTTAGAVQLWRSLSSGTSATDWTTLHSHGGQFDLAPGHFALSNVQNFLVYGLSRAASTAEAGVHRIEAAAGGYLGQIFSSQIFGLVSFQNRLVLNAAGRELRFTDPGSATAFPSSNNLTVGDNYQGQGMSPLADHPSDLFVFNDQQGVFRIQGDIGAGPIIREAGLTRYPPKGLAHATKMPGGIAYLVEGEGVFLNNGTDSILISPQFVGSPMHTPIFADSLFRFLGSVAYGGHWLFTPNGYIYDANQNLWWRTTFPKADVPYPFLSYTKLFGRMWIAGVDSGGAISLASASIDLANTVRTSSFVFTLPLLDTQERSIQVRQIEVFGQGFGNGGTWRLEISNDRGQLETTTHPVPARAASIRAITKLDGDWLKIRVLSQGNPDASQSVTQASEAPMIDRIVVWARPKTRRI